MPILVTGGARSGKSTFAEQLSMRLCSEGIYIATAQIYDDEMQERIELHHQQRDESGFLWRTREEPYALFELLEQQENLERQEQQDRTAGEPRPVVLVDCLTLWLSNWLLKVEDQADASSYVMDKITELVQLVSTYSGQLVLVTNEVGSGIVPEYRLGRQFRDLAGKMNQRLAAVCEQVFLVTAGIPIELKSRAYRMGEGER
jgi:adenosylcobinamide kinase/adenosylcobinamide-phosphate guanylyltransferase